MAEEILNPKEKEEEFEATLRPKKFHEFIGQDQVKENLKITIFAAQKRKEPIDHILFYGPPGLGKTTLANVVANEMGSKIRVTSGPAIERAGDLASLLTNLEQGDVLFIDEIHRLNKLIEEMLYPAMEEYGIDIIIGKGPSARSLRLELPRFTIIGATTRPSLISSPLRDRFGVVHRLDFYDDDSIKKILGRSAKILNVQADERGLAELTRRSRKTPRIANRILKRVRDFADVKAKGKITREVALAALDLLSIDEYGLDLVDKKIIETIIHKFKGGPVGLGTLSVAISEEKETLEEVHEPYLIQIGFLERTLRGRKATERAYKYLNIKTNSKQQRLI